MAELYGERAEAIFNSLESLDPELNELIQRFAYDKLWLRAGLSTREKSLATLAAVVAGGRERAMRLHMIGFLTTGGTLDELRAVLLHLVAYVGFPPVLAAFSVLHEVKAELSPPSSEDPA